MDKVLNMGNTIEECFKDLFDTYHSPLYYFILDKSNSHDLAEEVVQLTFIRLWDKRHQISEQVDPSKLLFTIARNIFIDELRKTKKKTDFSEVNQMVDQVATNNTFETIIFKDTTSRIEKLMTKMPPVRQNVFYFSRMLQLNHKEIAAKMSISPKTVEAHISQAIKFLRRNM